MSTTSRRGQPPLSVRLPAGGGGDDAAPSALPPDLPPISALFLIDFDVKAGYEIIWQRAAPGLDLEGAVEYKSLPSGLHTVPEDLIYFVHEGGGGHAGLSAFVNTRTDEAEARHARMIAVGVLVPLSYGRLGRAWRHAERLREMAAQLVEDRKQTQALEQYWEKARARDTAKQPAPCGSSPLSSPALSFHRQARAGGPGHSRNRSASDGTALVMPPGRRLSPYHPAWSLTALLDTFGPLIFPIHRAALLRRRILISTHAPVHEVCNYVYAISVLANIPLSVLDLLAASAPSQRLRPLFNVGVHDIPFLMEDHAAASKRRGSTAAHQGVPRDEKGSGWIACTTDSILAVKDELWDVLVTMPPPHAAHARERAWPAVEGPRGAPIKATQRDLRRFRSLRAGLRRLAPAAPADGAPRPEGGAAPPARRATPSPGEDDALVADAAEKVVEPVTWAALAYSGFMWWASAGEQGRSDEAEEAALDAALLADLGPPTPAPARPPSPQQQRKRNSAAVAAVGGAGMGDSLSSLTLAGPTDGAGEGGGREEDDDNDDEEEDEDPARAELVIVAYFHRLTAQGLSVLADLAESSDEDDEDEDDGDLDGEEEALLLRGEDDYGGGEDDEDDGDGSGRGGGRGGRVRVGSEALAAMGLDVWSAADAAFVRELAARYFARRAHVEGKGVEVCGLRVC